MQVRAYFFATATLLGLVACSSPSPAVVSATPTNPQGDQSARPSIEEDTAVTTGLRPSGQPILLANTTDFSSWNLPDRDLPGHGHSLWSASVSDNSEWEISYRRVTEQKEGQLTLRGTEEDGVASKRYSHEAFAAASSQASEVSPNTKVLFNKRYTYWGQVLQLVDKGAEVQYVSNGQLKQTVVAIEELLVVHVSIDRLGTVVVWREGERWLGGSTVLATNTGVYVVGDSHQLYFLSKDQLIANDQHKHQVGDRVLARSKNSKQWQPATIKEVVKNHAAYVITNEANEVHTLDWAHIFRVPAISQ
ncbi:MAG: hypothetical protein JKY56_00585 [Kofleriaceae bacterium]|nr:hypothetical protein [Kofleriaceae bacterium]